MSGMKDLVINYSISKNLKYLAIISGVYLFGISAGVSIFQTIAKNYSFLFYVGLAGVVIALVLVLTFFLMHYKPVITITNEHFQVCLPKQDIDGVIEWDNVTQVGIGLSYITFKTHENENYKIDLENLKYVDIRAIKSRLIEICEEKNIAYSN
jgi:hypothetical protein